MSSENSLVRLDVLRKGLIEYNVYIKQLMLYHIVVLADKRMHPIGIKTTL